MPDDIPPREARLALLCEDFVPADARLGLLSHVGLDLSSVHALGVSILLRSVDGEEGKEEGLTRIFVQVIVLLSDLSRRDAETNLSRRDLAPSVRFPQALSRERVRRNELVVARLET